MHTNTPLLVGDAARIRGKSPETIRVWIRTGRLKAQRTPGGVYIIEQADLMQVGATESGDGHAAA